MKKVPTGRVYRKDRKVAVLTVSRIEGLANIEKTSYFYPSVSLLLIRWKEVTKGQSWHLALKETNLNDNSSQTTGG